MSSGVMIGSPTTVFVSTNSLILLIVVSMNALISLSIADLPFCRLCGILLRLRFCCLLLLQHEFQITDAEHHADGDDLANADGEYYMHNNINDALKIFEYLYGE